MASKVATLQAEIDALKAQLKDAKTAEYAPVRFVDGALVVQPSENSREKRMYLHVVQTILDNAETIRQGIAEGKLVAWSKDLGKS